jgi:uncharacterized Tic20 family protein
LVGLGTLLDTDSIAVLVILGPFLLWLVALEHILAFVVELLFIGDTLADGRIGLVLAILDKGGTFLGTLGLTDRAIGGVFRPLLLGLFALGFALAIGVELLRVLDTLADGGVGLLVTVLHESGTFLGALGLADRAAFGGVFSPLLFRLGALGRAFAVSAELFAVLDTLADSLIVGAIAVKLGTLLRTLLIADRTIGTIFGKNLVLLGALEYTGVINELLGLVLAFADGVALGIITPVLRTRDRALGGVAVVVGELLVGALAFADETGFVVGSLEVGDIGRAFVDTLLVGVVKLLGCFKAGALLGDARRVVNSAGADVLAFTTSVLLVRLAAAARLGGSGVREVRRLAFALVARPN